METGRPQVKELKAPQASAALTESCLQAFLQGGTLDLSLDQLAVKVGISKRMLIHYYGARELLEIAVMDRLEDLLRARFRPGAFPPRTSARTAVMALWDQTADPASRGVLLLIMDVSRRGWSGSSRAKAFYQEQQRLWIELLQPFLPSHAAVKELLQLFQGAVLVYLVTGDRDQGRRTLARMIQRTVKPRAGAKRSLQNNRY